MKPKEVGQIFGYRLLQAKLFKCHVWQVKPRSWQKLFSCALIGCGWTSTFAMKPILESQKLFLRSSDLHKYIFDYNEFNDPSQVIFLPLPFKFREIFLFENKCASFEIKITNPLLSNYVSLNVNRYAFLRRIFFEWNKQCSLFTIHDYKEL